MDKSLRQQHRLPPDVPVFADSRVSQYLRELTDYLISSFSLESKNTEQFYYGTLEDNGTPSVMSHSKHSYWVTGGASTITDFLNGYYGQIIVIVSEHDLTVESNDDIHLLNGTSYVMHADNTLALVLKDDGDWYELWRGGVGEINYEILLEFEVSSSVAAQEITPDHTSDQSAAAITSEIRESDSHSEFESYNYSVSSSDATQKVTMDETSDQGSAAIGSEIVTSVV